MVECEDQSGKVVARGLVNYAANEAKQIIGQPSQNIESILGFIEDESLIHRDNLVLCD